MLFSLGIHCDFLVLNPAIQKIVGAFVFISLSRFLWYTRLQLTNCHSSSTNPFLHDLQLNHKLHSLSRIQIPRTSPHEHQPIRSLFPAFFSSFEMLRISWNSASANLFSLSFPCNEACLIFSSNFHKPSRRLQEPRYGDE
jgi:hypothetical protein